MNILKTILSVLSILVGLVILFVFVLRILGLPIYHKNLAEGMDLRLVKPGMNMENVIDIIGKPLVVKASVGLHDLTCKNNNDCLRIKVGRSTKIKEEVNKYYQNKDYCCTGNKQDLKTKEIHFSYTTSSIFLDTYPWVGIYFDSVFKVTDIYVEQNSGLFATEKDDLIYRSAWKTKLDTTNMKEIVLNEVENYMNEELYYKYFK